MSEINVKDANLSAEQVALVGTASIDAWEMDMESDKEVVTAESMAEVITNSSESILGIQLDANQRTKVMVNALNWVRIHRSSLREEANIHLIDMAIRNLGR